tara:strand:+ start:2367 stop:2618 length:252 start_codon:yes stop_codon:yes gene_type:complete
MLLADGLEKAFVGSTISAFNRNQVALYDYDKCIQVFMDYQDMSEEEAIDHFNYNVIGSWLGDGTPIFINQHSLETVEDYLEDV